LKSKFLEFLLQQTKQKKNIPLNQDQRVTLVKLLLSPRVKKFDFAVFVNPDYLHSEEEEEEFLMWTELFDDFWPELAAKCPNLLHVREMRTSYKAVLLLMRNC
jgi:hypothetical protein